MPPFSAFGGQPPSPSAFMSPPGMTPQQFALLMAMQNRQQQNPMAGQGGAPQIPSPGGPQMPGAPNPMGGGGMPPQGAQIGSPPGMLSGGGGPNQMIQQLLQNPQLLRMLLGGMGGGAQGALPGQ
jgi:hypothetical protein